MLGQSSLPLQSLDNMYEVCNFYNRMFPSCSHVTDEHHCVMKIRLKITAKSNGLENGITEADTRANRDSY